MYTILWPKRRPREPKQSNRLKRRKEKQPPESRFWRYRSRVLAPFLPKPDDGGHVGCVGEEVAEQNGYEGKPGSNCAEPPLLIHWAERFEEGEDQSVAEATEKREPENDGLGEEHVEGSGIRQCKSH